MCVQMTVGHVYFWQCIDRPCFLLLTLPLFKMQVRMATRTRKQKANLHYAPVKYAH